MIASIYFPPPGTKVGCEYRWPYDHAHPDCWQPPHEGVILHLDDPKAWEGSIAFPEGTSDQGKITEHVLKLLKDGLLKTHVPVLYTNSMDGSQFMQWDRKLRPYNEELDAWSIARQEKYKNS